MTSRVSALQRTSVAFALVLSSVAFLSADALRIVPLVRDGTVLISFSMPDGFTDDVRAAIRSGLRTTFTYTVDLRAEVPAWVDRTIASAVVSTAVQYDNLTRRHTVVRTLDGRTEQAQVTESDAEVRQLVTTIDGSRSSARSGWNPIASITSACAPKCVPETVRSSGRGAALRPRKPSSPSFPDFRIPAVATRERPATASPRLSVRTEIRNKIRPNSRSAPSSMSRGALGLLALSVRRAPRA